MNCISDLLFRENHTDPLPGGALKSNGRLGLTLSLGVALSDVLEPAVKTSASTAKAVVFAAEWLPALLSAGICGSKATGRLHTSIHACPATRAVLAILSKSRWVSASAG